MRIFSRASTRFLPAIPSGCLGFTRENLPNQHRKKQSNTLYTINALNEVIRELNGGVLDKRFPIPWDDYYNSLLLTNENGLNKIPTKIHSIVDTKNYKEK